MKTLYKKLFLLSAILLMLHACTKEEASIEEETIKLDQIDVAKQSATYEGLFEYARLLSIAIHKNKGMNETLQEKALELEKIGYYEQEFYVGMQGASPAKEFGSQSLNSMLEEIDGAKSATKIQSYLKTNPAMSVLLIGDSQSKGFSNRVYVDNGFDDMDAMEMVYFYENGQLQSTSVGEEPTSKAFIVRNSEVYINENDAISKATNDAGVELFSYADGRSVKVNTGAMNTDAKLVPIDDEPGGGGGGGSYPPPSNCNEPCERDCESGTENLWRFRTRNDYDGFLRGKGEWFFVIIWADGANYTLQNGGVTVTGSALSYLRTGQINNVRDDYSWHYPNFSSIIWNRVASPTNPVADGNRIKVACFESDGGSTQTFTATLTYNLATQGAGTFGFSLPISFTINDGDDFIGEYIVEYCHDIGSNGFMYNPAYQVNFQHNER